MNNPPNATDSMGMTFNEKRRFEQAPCFRCGYNGHSYYQPEIHSCAKFYHLPAPSEEQSEIATLRSQLLSAQRAAEEARGRANALSELLHQITHALGLNANADPENNQHIIDRAKYLSEQFTADRYVATEQARVAAKKHLETACMYSRMHDKAIADRDTAIAALSQALGEWVSVKDRMPTEIDSVVLIARRSPSFGMKVESARYTADAFIGASAWWHHESYVTHWRPLPHPPETSTASGV
jgi:hypothetical protein